MLDIYLKIYLLLLILFNSITLIFPDFYKHDLEISQTILNIRYSSFIIHSMLLLLRLSNKI
jgi:hypothetical protein